MWKIEDLDICIKKTYLIETTERGKKKGKRNDFRKDKTWKIICWRAWKDKRRGFNGRLHPQWLNWGRRGGFQSLQDLELDKIEEGGKRIKSLSKASI